jgi:glyoxylase-like metal-dependent hydrolase (beta-lactamase superfamily II)
LSTELACDGSQFDRLLKQGEDITVGDLTLRCLHVPGHTPDHLCYLVGDAVFTGDTLFMPDGGTARCDFPAGSSTQLYHAIQKNLYTLPDTTRVFVGHDYQPNQRGIRYQTTLFAQKSSNIHLKHTTSEQEFVAMRDGRDRTLAPPKLIYPSLTVNIRAGNWPQERSGLFPDRPMIKIPIRRATPEPSA